MFFLFPPNILTELDILGIYLQRPVSPIMPLIARSGQLCPPPKPIQPISGLERVESGSNCPIRVFLFPDFLDAPHSFIHSFIHPLSLAAPLLIINLFVR